MKIRMTRACFLLSYITVSLMFFALHGADEGDFFRLADDARFENAYYFVTIDMPDKALRLLSEYIEVYSDGIHRKEALMTIGDIHYGKFNYPKAQYYYMMLFQEFSNTEDGVEAYYRSALCYLKMGKREEANRVFTDIITNYSTAAAADKARLQRDIESILAD